jgi:hypothetical protein
VAQRPEERRRVQRIRLSHPVFGQFANFSCTIIDVGLGGARIEHNTPIQTGKDGALIFHWQGRKISFEAVVLRSKLERFSGPEALTVYHSGLRFTAAIGDSVEALRDAMVAQVVRALNEQKANARGEYPIELEKMPIFQSGLLSATRSEVSHELAGRTDLEAQIAKAVSYISCSLDRNRWRKVKTQSPQQPPEGFTVLAQEDPYQIDLLCETYENAGEEMRQLIRVLAELSVTEDAGIPPGRFEP